MKLTCKKCLHYTDKGTCRARHISLPAECDICPFFADQDGKRPRFCRLASSVDEMASSMVFFENYWFFTESTDPYDTIEEAIAAAKAWLTENENK